MSLWAQPLLSCLTSPLSFISTSGGGTKSATKDHCLHHQGLKCTEGFPGTGIRAPTAAPGQSRELEGQGHADVQRGDNFQKVSLSQGRQILEQQRLGLLWTQGGDDSGHVSTVSPSLSSGMALLVSEQPSPLPQVSASVRREDRASLSPPLPHGCWGHPCLPAQEEGRLLEPKSLYMKGS